MQLHNRVNNKEIHAIAIRLGEGTSICLICIIRTTQHASTRVTPFRMMYGYDPILPFQYADKMKHVILSGDDAACESDVDICLEVSGDTSRDPVTTRINGNGKKTCKTIYAKASKSIKKAQKHQAKCYNNRQNKGKPFEIGDLCLKCNKCKDSHMVKLKHYLTQGLIPLWPNGGPLLSI